VAVKRVGLVVTDLDGTLLDRETYEVGPALDAVAALREAGVPLVLCSSKTRAEMEPLAARIGVDGPLVVENGGAILAPAGSLQAWPPWDRVEGGRAALVLGVPRERLVEALPEVARDAGARVRPFASMSVGEVAALTGLAEDEAALAMRREYDEPFVVEDPPGRDPALDARLDRAARGRGLRVTHGGRVHHLTGPADKGQAVRALVHVWPGGVGGDVVGLGDAANDLALLQEVTRPIVMPRPDGTVDPALAARLHGRERAPLPGPAGWSAAVLAVLAGEDLPKVGA
jgi:mannosyl-3-phosphoglycerate phosphatase